MISGKGAIETARGKRNAFYNTLEELHKYFDRIDVVCSEQGSLFGNVFFHAQVPEKEFDVMTVHEYAPFRNGRMANQFWKKTKTPMIFEIMHIPGLPKAGNLREHIAHLMTRWYIKYDVRNAKAVRVINKQVGDWLAQRGVPREKIHVVSAMYIDLDIFKNLNIEKKYEVIYVGRRAKNKGIELFEKAGQGFKTLIVDGWAKDAHEVATLINQSKVLVMPSYNEGGPRVVLEAFACNVPVLATPVGIVPEVVSPEFIIDWSPRRIGKKIKAVLDGTLQFIKPDLSRFEKKEAIKTYAEFIDHHAKS
ncbi:MAG: glycosyltransferase [Patescibacteria group bacterium]